VYSVIILHFCINFNEATGAEECRMRQMNKY
jgi:hypothetical protein